MLAAKSNMFYSDVMKTATQESFGALIFRLRQGKLIPRMALARRLGITSTYLGQIEDGSRRPPPVGERPAFYEALSLALGVRRGVLEARAAKERGEATFRFEGHSPREVEEILRRLARWQREATQEGDAG